MFAYARRSQACALRCGLATRSIFSEASQVFSAPSMGRWDASCRHGSGAQELVERLEKAFGKAQVSTNKDVLLAHGSDESFHDPSDVLPDVVFSPRNEDEVVEAMKISASLGAPVIPFGVGTSLEGHVAALQGGLSIDFGAHMNQVKEINEEDMDCTVQAGITRVALNEQLKQTGLFFPVDPGADATIGGMVATNASGTSAVKYGTMKQNVLGLRCVLADGTVVNTGSRARKSSAGYDLTSLMVGSEGTLASITDVTLKLHIQPPAVASAVCAFDSTEGAVQTVVSALQYGVPIARAEFLDTQSVQAVHARFPDLGDMLPENRPCLFLEFHGSDHAITEQISVVKELSESNQLASPFQFAHKQEERNALWKARHQAYYAALQLRPGSRGWPTDVCVPISQLASCIEETIDDIHSTGLQAPLFGHIGDGNFHVILLARPDEPTEYLERLVGFNDRLVQRALKAGGTCTGEHGVGYGKRKWMQLEHGKPAVELMQTIKRALDPEGRMNPGKAI